MDASVAFANEWKKILIVDEYKLVQNLLAAELNDEGYEVESFYSPAGLLKEIRDNKPDLVIMETCFENNDGLEILQEIRNNYYNLPVIIWTVSSTKRYDLRALAADYYIVKSPDIDELKQKIKKALETNFPPPPISGNGGDKLFVR